MPGLICHHKSSLYPSVMVLNLHRMLTHCGLVTPYGIRYVDQHCFRQWLVICLVPSHHMTRGRLIVNWTIKGTTVNKLWIKIWTLSLKKMYLVAILFRPRFVNSFHVTEMCTNLTIVFVLPDVWTTEQMQYRTNHQLSNIIQNLSNGVDVKWEFLTKITF